MARRSFVVHRIFGPDGPAGREFEVESLMFDVDGKNLKPITSNIIHQTSNIKERGTSHDDISFHATSPYAQGRWPCIFLRPAVYILFHRLYAIL